MQQGDSERPCCVVGRQAFPPTTETVHTQWIVVSVWQSRNRLAMQLWLQAALREAKLARNHAQLLQVRLEQQEDHVALQVVRLERLAVFAQPERA